MITCVFIYLTHTYTYGNLIVNVFVVCSSLHLFQEESEVSDNVLCWNNVLCGVLITVWRRRNVACDDGEMFCCIWNVLRGRWWNVANVSTLIYTVHQMSHVNMYLRRSGKKLTALASCARNCAVHCRYCYLGWFKLAIVSPLSGHGCV